MSRLIALLRGINVSGQKKIKMSELKNLFESLEFQDVEAYIQSGNVIFSSKQKSSTKLANKISSEIKTKYNFDVQVIILTPQEIDRALKNNPFVKKKKETERLYVTFLSSRPSAERINKLEEISFLPEEYSIKEKAIYLFFPNGSGKAKLNNNFIEKKLNVIGTTRNWKTVNALSELVNGE